MLPSSPRQRRSVTKYSPPDLSYRYGESSIVGVWFMECRKPLSREGGAGRGVDCKLAPCRPRLVGWTSPYGRATPPSLGQEVQSYKMSSTQRGGVRPESSWGPRCPRREPAERMQTPGSRGNTGGTKHSDTARREDSRRGRVSCSERPAAARPARPQPVLPQPLTAGGRRPVIVTLTSRLTAAAGARAGEGDGRHHSGCGGVAGCPVPHRWPGRGGPRPGRHSMPVRR